MTAFWKAWLASWCWIVVVFGAVLTGAASEVTDGPTRLLIAVMNPSIPPQLDPLHRFAIGLMGAVTLGWGLTLRVAIAAAHRLGDAAGPAWRGLATAVLIWFAIDSMISIATGLALNAVSNAVLTIGLLIPLSASGVLTAQPQRMTA